jgi:hypothetical protein
LRVPKVLPRMPHLTRLRDTAGDDMDMILTVPDHHPRVLRVPHPLSKVLAGVRPFLIRQAPIPRS